MNKRTIILDFTSLLDVVLIILFFFIMFSHLETEEEKAALNQAQQAAAQAQQAAADKEHQADKLMEDIADKLAEAEKKEQLANDKLAEAELAEERSGANAEGINDFSLNKNLRIRLKIIDGSNNWCLEVYKGEEKAFTVSKSSNSVMSYELITKLTEYGYLKKDTILCVFLYDASERGSNSAFEDVTDIFRDLKKHYPHFFYSEIDNSLFEED